MIGHPWRFLKHALPTVYRRLAYELMHESFNVSISTCLSLGDKKKECRYLCDVEWKKLLTILYGKIRYTIFHFKEIFRIIDWLRKICYEWGLQGYLQICNVHHMFT